MTKPKLKEVQADLRKAAEILGKEDMTIREYRPIARKHDLIMPQKIVAELGWNRMKTFVFGGDYKPRKSNYSLKEKLQALRRAMNIHGVDMSCRQYELFAKGKDIPTRSTMIREHRWQDIKNLALNNTTIKEMELEKEKKEFCDLCVDKKSCKIEIENCKYWKERVNEVY